MRAMVEHGEVDALVAERVWQELARGLMEAQPSRMLAVLRECGALARIMPELDALWGVPQPPLHHPEIDTGVHVMLVVDYAAERGFDLPVRFAALMHDLGKGATPPESWPATTATKALGVKLVEALCQRLKVPNDCRDLALMTAREHGNVSRAEILRPNTIVKLFERCDGFRKPQRFSADAAGGRMRFPRPRRRQPRLRHAAVSAGAVSARCAGCGARGRCRRRGGALRRDARPHQGSGARGAGGGGQGGAAGARARAMPAPGQRGTWHNRMNE